DRAAICQRRHVDSMAHALESQIDALMSHAFTAEAIADPRVVHQIDSPLLENAGAHALDDVLLAAVFDDEGVDTSQMKKVTEHQAGRASAHDSDLRAYGWHGAGRGQWTAPL